MRLTSETIPKSGPCHLAPDLVQRNWSIIKVPRSLNLLSSCDQTAPVCKLRTAWWGPIQKHTCLVHTRFKRNVQAQDGATPARGGTSVNQTLDNFCVPVNALLWLKMQPTKHQANSGLCAYFPVPSHCKQSWLFGPNQSDIFYFLFIGFYSLSYKRSCFLSHFIVLQMETVYSMKYWICLYHLNCLLNPF